ncbi:unnamed protein product [Polarella glacialis]|uniref:Uncharacterized protein n=1 Tax=Polarella glacialis TaxID=89957 RepID=A0A813F3G5_POLGL|nr:unnamed protein product [Polarella glacialis]
MQQQLQSQQHEQMQKQQELQHQQQELNIQLQQQEQQKQQQNHEQQTEQQKQLTQQLELEQQQQQQLQQQEQQQQQHQQQMQLQKQHDQSQLQQQQMLVQQLHDEQLQNKQLQSQCGKLVSQLGIKNLQRSSGHLRLQVVWAMWHARAAMQRARHEALLAKFRHKLLVPMLRAWACFTDAQHRNAVTQQRQSEMLARLTAGFARLVIIRHRKYTLRISFAEWQRLTAIGRTAPVAPEVSTMAASTQVGADLLHAGPLQEEPKAQRGPVYDSTEADIKMKEDKAYKDSVLSPDFGESSSETVGVGVNPGDWSFDQPVEVAAAALFEAFEASSSSRTPAASPPSGMGRREERPSVRPEWNSASSQSGTSFTRGASGAAPSAPRRAPSVPRGQDRTGFTEWMEGQEMAQTRFHAGHQYPTAIRSVDARPARVQKSLGSPRHPSPAEQVQRRSAIASPSPSPRRTGSQPGGAAVVNVASRLASNRTPGTPSRSGSVPPQVPGRAAARVLAHLTASPRLIGESPGEKKRQSHQQDEQPPKETHYTTKPSHQPQQQPQQEPQTQPQRQPQQTGNTKQQWQPQEQNRPQQQQQHMQQQPHRQQEQQLLAQEPQTQQPEQSWVREEAERGQLTPSRQRRPSAAATPSPRGSTRASTATPTSRRVSFSAVPPPPSRRPPGVSARHPSLLPSPADGADAADPEPVAEAEMISVQMLIAAAAAAKYDLSQSVALLEQFKGSSPRAAEHKSAAGSSSFPQRRQAPFSSRGVQSVETPSSKLAILQRSGSRSPSCPSSPYAQGRCVEHGSAAAVAACLEGESRKWTTSLFSEPVAAVAQGSHPEDMDHLKRSMRSFVSPPASPEVLKDTRSSGSRSGSRSPARWSPSAVRSPSCTSPVTPGHCPWHGSGAAALSGVVPLYYERDDCRWSSTALHSMEIAAEDTSSSVLNLSNNRRQQSLDRHSASSFIEVDDRNRFPLESEPPHQAGFGYYEPLQDPSRLVAAESASREQGRDFASAQSRPATHVPVIVPREMPQEGPPTARPPHIRVCLLTPLPEEEP